MMQKKILAALSVAALSVGFSVSSFASETGNQQTTIEFTGKIIDTPCSIGTDLNGAPVNLGTYPTEYFRNRDTAEEVAFNITIGECRLIESEGKPYGENQNGAPNFPIDRVRLSFTDGGQADKATARNGLMFLTETESAAQNVGILVKYNPQGNKSENEEGYTNVFTDSATSAVLVSQMGYREEGGKYYFPMLASISKIQKDTSVKAGDVKGMMTVTLNYE